MRATARRTLLRVFAIALCIGAAAGCSTTAAQHPQARFDRASLEAMVAPIALYPDPLLSHVLMAATYPREVDEAARWSRERPGLSGDAAVRVSAGWDWDPSVRSLLAFPLVLDTMARHMRWTEDLGEAFLEQREDVMEAVQQLRHSAYQSGNLRSNDYVRVFDSGRGIAIDPIVAQTVHVPHYDPRVVYGAWRFASPPTHWVRWPTYHDVPGRVNIVHWGPGVGLSTHFFFGGVYWPRREVRIVNVHTYYYPRKVVVERPVIVERPVVVERVVEVTRPAHVHSTPHHDVHPGVWRHDATRRHRRDVNETRVSRDPAPAASTRAVETKHETAARLAPASNATSNAAAERPVRHEPHAQRPAHDQSQPARARGAASAAGATDERRGPRSQDRETSTRADVQPAAATAVTTPPRTEPRPDETRRGEERRARDPRTADAAPPRANHAGGARSIAPGPQAEGPVAARAARPRERDRD